MARKPIGSLRIAIGILWPFLFVLGLALGGMASFRTL
jgi:hypothetical protein